MKKLFIGLSMLLSSQAMAYGYVWEVVQYGPGNGYEAPASCDASGVTGGCGSLQGLSCSSPGQRVTACQGRNRVDCVLECRYEYGGGWGRQWEVVQYGPGNGYEAPASCYASGHTTGCSSIAGDRCYYSGERRAACDGYNRIDCVVECR